MQNVITIGRELVPANGSLMSNHLNFLQLQQSTPCLAACAMARMYNNDESSGANPIADVKSAIAGSNSCL